MPSIREQFAMWRGKKSFGRSARLNDFYADLHENILMNVKLRSCITQQRDIAVKRGYADVVVFDAMLESVGNDARLSGIGKGFLPQNNLAILKAGEEVNMLADAIATVSFANRSRQQMKKVLLSNIVTPIIVSVAALSLLLVMGLLVVPGFASALPYERLPLAMRFAFVVTNFLVNFGYFIVPAAIGLVIWVVWSLDNWSGNARGLLDRIPPYNIYRYVVSSSLIVTFSGLVRSNVTLKNAIALLSENASGYERSHLRKIGRRLGGGERLSMALDTGLIPVQIIDRLQAHEAGGAERLNTAMRQLGFENFDRSLEVVSRSIQRTTMIWLLIAVSMLAWLGSAQMTVTPVILDMMNQAANQTIH